MSHHSWNYSLFYFLASENVVSHHSERSSPPVHSEGSSPLYLTPREEVRAPCCYNSRGPLLWWGKDRKKKRIWIVQGVDCIRFLFCTVSNLPGLLSLVLTAATVSNPIESLTAFTLVWPAGTWPCAWTKWLSCLTCLWCLLRTSKTGGRGQIITLWNQE